MRPQRRGEAYKHRFKQRGSVKAQDRGPGCVCSSAKRTGAARRASSGAFPRCAPAERLQLPRCVKKRGLATARAMEPVKFVALDEDDLEVVRPTCRTPSSRWPTSCGAPRKAPDRRAQPLRLGPRRVMRQPELRRAARRCASSACCLQVPQGQSRRQGRGAQPAGGRIRRDRLPGGVVTLTFSGRGAAARGRMPGGRARRSGASGPRTRGRPSRHAQRGLKEPWLRPAGRVDAARIGMRRPRSAPIDRTPAPAASRQACRPCRSASTAAPPISPRVSAPSSPPSARWRRTSSRRCAPSSPTSRRAATRR